MIQPSALEQQQLHVVAAPTFWHHVRFELVRRQAEEHGARRVIDVGAGAGLLGDHLHAGAIEYRWAESSPHLRTALAERFGADAAIGDDDPIDADSLVTLLDVIEHVPDDGGLLGGLSERMAPGAAIVVTVPAMRWLFSSWDRDLGHHRRYSRSGARSVVESAGFEVVESAYLFPELVPVAALRRFRSSDGSSAEFPRLPSFVDRVARTISGATARLRRWWPAGTSVLVVAVRSRA